MWKIDTNVEALKKRRGRHQARSWEANPWQKQHSPSRHFCSPLQCLILSYQLYYLDWTEDALLSLATIEADGVEGQPVDDLSDDIDQSETRTKMALILNARLGQLMDVDLWWRRLGLA